MTELHVFENDYEWVVAESEEDCNGAMSDSVGATYDDEDEIEWVQLPDDADLIIWLDDQGDVSDDGNLVIGQMSAWIEYNGRGLLCSSEY